jgi:transposase
MPKKIQLVKHLSRAELKEKYWQSADRRESRRWHLLWKIAGGWTIKDSALAVGLDYEYARRIVSKYNQQGIEAVSNKKKTVTRAGRPPLLTRAQLESLAVALKGRPSDGGVWTGPKVAKWIETHLLPRATARREIMAISR